MIRRAAYALFTISMISVPAFAQDVKSLNEARTFAAVAPAAADGADNAASAPVLRPVVPARTVRDRRPLALPMLYGSLATLQVYDIYSTTQGLQLSARETNPIMQQIVGRPLVFWSAKAVATIGPILMAERMWKSNKIGAIALMAASNGLMAAVAARNTSVLHQQQQQLGRR